MDGREKRFETTAVHGGERRPGPEGATVFPLYQSTVFGIGAKTDYHDVTYIRLNNNPTQVYLGDKLAALEGAEAALPTASGMAALSTILLGTLRTGDHLLAQQAGYGGTHELLAEHGPGLGWTHDLVDPHDPSSWRRLLRPTTRLFLVETISNPLVRVPRLADVASFCRENGLLAVVDNTFATPVNCRPLALGMDLVWHSATKYLNGHSDLVAGAILGSAERVGALRRTLNHLGGTIDPHAAWLLARGMKTLALRVRQQNASALALARALAASPAVLEVSYPGLESHRDHRVACEQLSGFGGMLSFRPRGGVAAAERAVSRLRIPTFAPSLGGVESLVVFPARTSHSGMPPAERARMGIHDDLLRVSVGIEATEDLVEDFRQALEG